MNPDKNLWRSWWIFTIFIIVGTTAYFISTHTKRVEFNLAVGNKINVKQLSLLSDNISLRLSFSRIDGESRPELGRYNKAPGEAIKLLISNAHQKILYKARPSNSRSSKFIYRPLNPNKDTLNFPLDETMQFLLRSGLNKIQVTVVEVGKSLIGEKVFLEINSPITFKVTSNKLIYAFLWYFFLWPVYIFILLVWVILLLVRKRRRRITKQ